jgi:NitT/TauT family transport system ATP-binding protein
MDEPFSALDVLTAETLRTDIIDLWIEGRLPIQSILMVTHDIEEAVLMCGRIPIFSSNPGRVVQEIKVDLAQPRNRLDPHFPQAGRSDLRAVTKPAPVERDKKASDGFHGTGIGMEICRVSTNRMAGFLETLAGQPYSGKADLPDLAATLQIEIDDLSRSSRCCNSFALPTPLMATSSSREGPQVRRADVDARKRMFHDHLLAYVPIASLHPARARRAAEPLGAVLTLQGVARGFHAGRRRDAAHGHQLGPLRRGLRLRRGEPPVHAREPDLTGLSR